MNGANSTQGVTFLPQTHDSQKTGSVLATKLVSATGPSVSLDYSLVVSYAVASQQANKDAVRNLYYCQTIGSVPFIGFVRNNLWHLGFRLKHHNESINDDPAGPPRAERH